jgi:hypothetical protein
MAVRAVMVMDTASVSLRVVTDSRRSIRLRIVLSVGEREVLAVGVGDEVVS